MGKSSKHFFIQDTLCHLLPEKQASLEKIFPTLKRRADIFWSEQKIAFEIQCSFIPLEEIQKRTRDYKTLGIDVVWIIDKALFGAYKPSDLVRNLGPYSHYFYENGQFFDRLTLFGARRAHFIKQDQKVFLANPMRTPCKRSILAAESLKIRYNRPIYFAGDFLDLCQNNPEELYQVIQQEKRLLSKTSSQSFFSTYIKSIYECKFSSNFPINFLTKRK